MKTNKFFSALLAKGKNAISVAGDKISSLLGGNALLDIKQLEKLVPNLSITDRKKVASSINLDVLFKTKRYDLAVRLGQIEEFVKRGLIDELIATYPPFREELGKEIWGQVISLIDEKMLDAYLKRQESKFDFFIYHPMGLKVLVKNEFSGFIAAREKEFRGIAEDFPEEFRAASPDARREYITLLNKFLD